jgi:hypothetical protein
MRCVSSRQAQRSASPGALLPCRRQQRSSWSAQRRCLGAAATSQLLQHSSTPMHPAALQTCRPGQANKLGRRCWGSRARCGDQPCLWRCWHPRVCARLWGCRNVAQQPCLLRNLIPHGGRGRTSDAGRPSRSSVAYRICFGTAVPDRQPDCQPSWGRCRPRGARRDLLRGSGWRTPLMPPATPNLPLKVVVIKYAEMVEWES